MQFVLVFTTVILQIISALIVAYTSDNINTLNIYLIIFCTSAFIINIIRFVLWGMIHNKYDLGKSYILTTTFFPLIYLISIYKQEAEFQLTKILGIILILAGLTMFKVMEKNG